MHTTAYNFLVGYGAYDGDIKQSKSCFQRLRILIYLHSTSENYEVFLVLRDTVHLHCKTL